MTDFLFVCGCPRSGTTLLANLLNAHPQIAIGIERYGNRYAREPLTPNLFTPERFYAIAPGDTFYDSLDFAPAYQHKQRTYADAALVGDKIPLLFDRFAALREHFPRAKVVFCLRNIVDVAASYEVRAGNPEDTTWNRAKGAAAAVEEWSRSLEAYHGFRDKIDMMVWDYDRFTQDGLAQIEQLVDWLGLDWCDPVERRVEMARARSLQLVERRQQPLNGAMKKHILLNAPIPLYRRAIRHAGSREATARGRK